MVYRRQCYHATLYLRMLSQTDLLSAVVDPEDQQQCDEVESSKKVLRKADVHPMACDVVENRKDVDKASRVPATTRC